MNLAPTGVTAYCKTSFIQTAILWQAGLALQHNFFADLAAQLLYQPDAENPLQKRIIALETELAFYLKLVERKL